MITFASLRQINPALRGVLRGTVMVGSSLRSAQWHQKLACNWNVHPPKTHGLAPENGLCLGGGGFKYFLIFTPENWGKMNPFWGLHIFQRGWNLKPPTSLLFVINGVISPLLMTLQMANWGLFHPLQVELWAPTHNCFFGGPTWYIGKNPSFCRLSSALDSLASALRNWNSSRRSYRSRSFARCHAGRVLKTMDAASKIKFYPLENWHIPWKLMVWLFKCSLFRWHVNFPVCNACFFLRRWHEIPSFYRGE